MTKNIPTTEPECHRCGHRADYYESFWTCEGCHAPLLSVKIPTLPPSVNSVYVPISIKSTTSRRGYNTIKMTKEATTWISQATLFLPPVKLPENTQFRMELEYHTDWYYKNGTLKNKDVRNYEKIITDTIFGRYKLSDRMVWESLVKKVQREGAEFVIVKLFSSNKK